VFLGVLGLLIGVARGLLGLEKEYEERRERRRKRAYLRRRGEKLGAIERSTPTTGRTKASASRVTMRDSPTKLTSAWERQGRTDMNKSDAQDASKILAGAIAVKIEDPDRSREIEHGVHRAVHDQLREMVPDAAIFAVLEDESAPMVVALSGTRLYVVTVGELPAARGPVPTILRMRNIDPLTAVVNCETKYSDHRDPDIDLQVTRETVWRFRVGDIDLKIETNISRDSSWVEKGERFAVALAKVIGMDVSAVDAQPLVAVR
jgi:hypothetical protein